MKKSGPRLRADLARAITKMRPVTIAYIKADGTDTLRTVEPYEIAETKDGNVIVRAMDRDSLAPRTWRLDRIVSYTIHRGTATVAVPVVVHQEVEYGKAGTALEGATSRGSVGVGGHRRS